MVVGIAVAALCRFAPISRKLLHIRLALALQGARRIADDPRHFTARLASDPNTPHWPWRRGLPAGSERYDAADRLFSLSQRLSGDEAARAAGAAQFVAGRCREAVRAFDSVRVRGAGDWNDLAAASICIAKKEGHADDWLTALAAADRALQRSPVLREAQFNRAAVVDAIGISSRARWQWSRYLLSDGDSAWARVTRPRLAAYKPDGRAIWLAALGRFSDLPESQVAQMTRAYPEQARRFAEGFHLGSWAALEKAGRHRDADRMLRAIRLVGLLTRGNGESLLAEAVATIDAARGERRSALVDGELAYVAGRVAIKEVALARAEHELRRAAERFARAASPMQSVADRYRIGVLIDQNRLPEARALLSSAQTRERDRAGHRSLRAQLSYELGRLEGVAGRWSDAIAAAEMSRSELLAIGERGNAADAASLVAEAYDLIGQPSRAWSYGFEALHGSVAAGTLDRTRATLAMLCRTELRGGRWDRAWSLVNLEAELAPSAPGPALDPDMFIRRAVAAWHRGDELGAGRSFGLARAAAERIDDPAARRKQAADVDAAEGAFVRRSDPRRAVALLSTAIGFQKSAERPIVLPELELERGRAYLAVGNTGAAERDFEAGLFELERQRAHLHDVELRPGIFDDATTLFDELIAVQIHRGATAEEVLRSVERGRARAMLEQLDEGAEPAVIPQIADVQRALEPGSALVEYVSLADRVVVLVISRNQSVMRLLPVPRANLFSAAQALVERRGGAGDALYRLLIAPLRDDLHGVSAINFVEDDMLQRLPFAALFDSAARTFLIQHYAVATSPSAGVLLKTLARARSFPATTDPKVLVFANPTIPREEFGDLASLTAAGYEASQIAHRYPHAEVFVGDDATSERFAALAPDFDFVHFSGHGVTNEREPFLSALVCASTPKMKGGLTARAIARMKFRRTGAVVLAACSTMTGRNASIEGVPSLSRAFLIAGVPAVVGTLWDIKDDKAAAITRPLHEQLARGIAPAEALRQAQLEAIRKGMPVAQWSAFALMGSAPAPR